MIKGVNASEKGVGFTMKGQDGWFNFARNLPTGYDQGAVLALAPEIEKGQRVRFAFTSPEGSPDRRNIVVRKDGSHELTIMNTAPPTPSQNGGDSYDSQENEQNVHWRECLRLAKDLYIARCSPDDARAVAPAAVLGMAWELFQGGPNENAEPIKADSERAVLAYEVNEPTAKPVHADGDPGPEYEGEAGG